MRLDVDDLIIYGLALGVIAIVYFAARTLLRKRRTKAD